ncbi:hypothetical protein CP970_36955 [Streptomyces kanamyceticus]|uniref:Uncharacterized protein n=1 Tax=Streptomyces kanamyceticus TaxID=1967 RepID=A0A5J6GKR6_STRKN|nr:hypothetical protein CP970_36955 [Streptomyces kanamyceticus]
MGPAHLPTGRRRRALVMVPASAESVPQRPQQPPPHQAPPHPAQPHQQPRQQPHPQAQHHQQPHPQPHPQPQAQPHLADPPIYRALIRHWSDRGRTLPGRPDPEWVRLAAPPVRHGQFSASRDPRGDGR